MCVFLGLGYFSQDIIFQFNTLDCKFYQLYMEKLKKKQDTKKKNQSCTIK